MSTATITVNGVPLHQALAENISAEVEQHLRSEGMQIARQCGLHSCQSTPSLKAGRRGRPFRSFSLPLLAELRVFLEDPEYSYRGISELFELRFSEVLAYAKRLGIRRTRGRKPRRAAMEAA